MRASYSGEAMLRVSRVGRPPLGIVEAQARQDEHELLAAVATRDVSAPNPGADQHANRPQQSVPRIAAMVVGNTGFEAPGSVSVTVVFRAIRGLTMRGPGAMIPPGDLASP
jgi:hypothetical protein